MGQLLITLGTLVLILISGMVILLVLMQRGSSQGGLGTAFGGGVAETAFGADTANVLTKGTVFSIAAFFALSFILYLGNLAVAHSDDRQGGTDFQALAAEAQSEDSAAAEEALRQALAVEPALSAEAEAKVEELAEEVEAVVDEASQTLDQKVEQATESIEKAADDIQDSAKEASDKLKLPVKE